MRADSVADVTDPHKWVIHGERLVDDTPRIRVSLAEVELPNHVRIARGEILGAVRPRPWIPPPPSPARTDE